MLRNGWALLPSTHTHSGDVKVSSPAGLRWQPSRTGFWTGSGPANAAGAANAPNATARPPATTRPRITAAGSLRGGRGARGIEHAQTGDGVARVHRRRAFVALRSLQPGVELGPATRVAADRLALLASHQVSPALGRLLAPGPALAGPTARAQRLLLPVDLLHHITALRPQHPQP